MNEVDPAKFFNPDGPTYDRWAVFNSHINNAGKKADKDFIAEFGRDKFIDIMCPLHKDGIMGIFSAKLTKHTRFWVKRVEHYVNAPDLSKPQAHIIVRRSGKKRASWFIKIDGDFAYAGSLLPGEFKTKVIAAGLAYNLASAYHESGYNVVLDTSGKY